MRKLFYLFFSVVFAVVFVPALIILFFGFGGREALPREGDITITALINGDIKEYNLEEYLFGVVAAEMPASFHKEALKAQAVAARTYIVNKMRTGDSDHDEADVCADSTHCKAYLTDEQIKEKHGDNWIREYSGKIKSAIEETNGEIAVWGGEPIEAVFHSSGSGVTENAKDVWGGDVPYLVSVESPGDVHSPTFLNDVTVSFESFSEKIKEHAGGDVSPYIGDISRNESGSVKTIDLGGALFDGVKVREIFSLPSTNFTVSAGENEFVFHCRGKGHGVGMSQYGAEYFAKQGMEYKDILKKYYTGIDVVNIGEANDKGN